MLLNIAEMCKLLNCDEFENNFIFSIDNENPLFYYRRTNIWCADNLIYLRYAWLIVG